MSGHFSLRCGTEDETYQWIESKNQSAEAQRVSLKDS
jgi:hypothetical protein